LPVGVFITSEAGHTYFANTEAVRLLGRGLRPDVGGESLPEVYHAYVGGTDRLYPAQDTPLVRAGRGESAVVDDMDIHQPSGVVLPVEVRGKPIFAADGTIEFAMAAFIDISGRRAADQAVADQASLLDLAHDAIIVSDTQRRITYWNHGAERTYGFTRAQALGRVASEMLETQYPIAMADIDADIDASGSWQGELIQRCRDGHSIVVASRWAARRAADGTRVATMEINRDITDAKEASAYARRLIEASPDSLVLIGLDGTITDVNEAAERVTATPREQLVGAGFGSFFTEPERALEGYQRALTDGVLTDFPLVVRRPDGALVDEMVNASLYRSATDDVVGVFVTARDVTEHNRAQRELTRRAADLEQSNTALTRSNAELEQFAYIASHDLSEPLRSIYGFADLLRLRYHGSLDTDADAFLDFITAGTTRMQHLIDDLLAYSRLTTRAHPLTPVDLQQVMDIALADLDARIGDTGAKVRIDTTLPVVTGDATQLTQVFTNLIRNAITYITPGTTPDVHVSADRDGPFWRFTVADNGIGIPPEHRERVFGMFKRLHSRDSYPGTGVGLAIVQKVVHRHEGTTTIADNPAGGTRITFTIRDTTPDITSDPRAGADCDDPDRWVLR
jgi:PAS domain S-box-containing protein